MIKDGGGMEAKGAWWFKSGCGSSNKTRSKRGVVGSTVELLDLFECAMDGLEMYALVSVPWSKGREVDPSNWRVVGRAGRETSPLSSEVACMGAFPSED